MTISLWGCGIDFSGAKVSPSPSQIIIQGGMSFPAGGRGGCCEPSINVLLSIGKYFLRLLVENGALNWSNWVCNWDCTEVVKKQLVPALGAMEQIQLDEYEALSSTRGVRKCFPMERNMFKTHKGLSLSGHLFCRPAPHRKKRNLLVPLALCTRRGLVWAPEDLFFACGKFVCCHVRHPVPVKTGYRCKEGKPPGQAEEMLVGWAALRSRAGISVFLQKIIMERQKTTKNIFI